MAVPEGWGKCTIPQMGSEEYKKRFCDPNKEKKVEKDTSPPPPKLEQNQPGQLPQADAGNRTRDWDNPNFVLGED